MDGFIMCSKCIHQEDCEDKESRDGCYFGEEEEENFDETMDR